MIIITTKRFTLKKFPTPSHTFFTFLFLIAPVRFFSFFVFSFSSFTHDPIPKKTDYVDVRLPIDLPSSRSTSNSNSPATTRTTPSSTIHGKPYHEMTSLGTTIAAPSPSTGPMRASQVARTNSRMENPADMILKNAGT